jgi:hypothetical protein
MAGTADASPVRATHGRRLGPLAAVVVRAPGLGRCRRRGRCRAWVGPGMRRGPRHALGQTCAEAPPCMRRRGLSWSRVHQSADRSANHGLATSTAKTGDPPADRGRPALPASDRSVARIHLDCECISTASTVDRARGSEKQIQDSLAGPRIGRELAPRRPVIGELLGSRQCGAEGLRRGFGQGIERGRRKAESAPAWVAVRPLYV